MTLVMDADRAVDLKDGPDERYEYSIQYLPLPAAFRHAAIALRTKIRERKREGEPFEDVLKDLYMTSPASATPSSTKDSVAR